MSRVHKSLPDCSAVVTLVSRPIVLFRLGCDGGLCFNEHFIPYKRFGSLFLQVPCSAFEQSSPSLFMKIALVCAICISSIEKEKKKFLLYSRYYLRETVFQLSLRRGGRRFPRRRWETKLHFLYTAQCTLKRSLRLKRVGRIWNKLNQKLNCHSLNGLFVFFACIFFFTFKDRTLIPLRYCLLIHRFNLRTNRHLISFNEPKRSENNW